MNDLERMENQINEQIKVLDQYEHPGISDALARTVVRSMVRQHRQSSIVRYLFRIGIPMAAAAGLILAAWISFSSRSLYVNTSNGGETASIWTLFAGTQEVEAYHPFSDLDFSTVATRPATTQAVDETTQEMDQYLIDMMNKS